MKTRSVVVVDDLIAHAFFIKCLATSSLRTFLGIVTLKYLRIFSKSNCIKTVHHILAIRQ
ncbi:hypothetical protein FWK35_00015665 [Aphis craccivora]|uniref:Uncharacterized protein n=1 Tax=Aphis craccivora TaxID=307492 RepID=A0A6G0YTE1_APHCR|nr:hypothetical protein FWK35_00015665 [Aphis craccivora]